LRFLTYVVAQIAVVAACCGSCVLLDNSSIPVLIDLKLG
jgi:hypothetical protein